MSWEKVKLGNICTMLSGNAWAASNFKDSGIIPIIRIQNLGNNENEKFIWWDEKYDSKFVIKAGDLLLSLSGSIKVDTWKGIDSLLNQRIVKLVPNQSVDFRWFYWQILNIILDIERMGKWALVNNVSITDLKELEISLPPLPIQKRIAEILDAADALKRKDQQLLKKYDELAQAIFIDMFGDPVRNEKGWDVKRIVEVTLNFDSYRKPVKSSDREQIQGIYPYYGATGIIDYVNEYLLDGQFLLISEDGKNLLGRYKKIAFLAEGKIWVNNHAHVLRGKENCNIYYLEYFLNKIDLTPYVTGIDQYKLNRSNLDIVPILLPPIYLQNKFEALIKDIENQVLQAIKQQSLAINLFDKLIQKAFTGELVS